MIIACEIPIPRVETISIFTDYDFPIVHLALEDKKYADFYRGQADKGRYVILDNAAFDAGHPMTTDDLLRAMDIIHPTEIVAPDVMYEPADLTLRLIDEFCDNLEKRDLDDISVMGVATGVTVDEFMHCVDELNKHERVDVIGISYRWKNEIASIARYDRVRAKLYFMAEFEKPVHLLGLWDANELVQYDQYIRSVDTSLPVQCGIYGLRMGTPECIKPEAKLDYFQEMSDEQTNLAVYNIMYMQKTLFEAGIK